MAFDARHHLYPSSFITTLLYSTFTIDQPSSLYPLSSLSRYGCPRNQPFVPPHHHQHSPLHFPTQFCLPVEAMR